MPLLGNGRVLKGSAAVADESSELYPARLVLPEVVELMTSHLQCKEDQARELLERAVHSRSLRDIETQYPDGMEIETDITTWKEIDWDEGIVTIEPSWAGSPAATLPVYPLFSLGEVCRHFHIDIQQDETAPRRRGGRPTKYDWDAFWVEVCRRMHEEGLPETQEKLVGKMQGWFTDRGEENIDPRTIEKKIAKLLEVLRQD
jgi:hypothetical protein